MVGVKNRDGAGVFFQGGHLGQLVLELTTGQVTEFIQRQQLAASWQHHVVEQLLGAAGRGHGQLALVGLAKPAHQPAKEQKGNQRDNHAK